MVTTKGVYKAILIGSNDSGAKQPARAPNNRASHSHCQGNWTAQGRVEPILIAEGTQRSIVLHLGDLAEDYEDIINQMFLMGSKLAQRNDVGELRQAYFISEARMDLVPGDVGRNLPLSEDPNAQAVVVIANLTIPDEKLKRQFWK